MKALLQPQEIEVFYIIPTIRGHFAKYLKEQGKSQKEIAKILMLQESTVSQYITKKRAAHITFSKEIENDLQAAAKNLKSYMDVIRETQTLLAKIRTSGSICRIHQAVTNIPLPCKKEEMGCTARR